MNKQEYLERLEACLKHKLSREEIDDIMRDYAEYFEEGRRQSKQDSEISAKLGDPELVAQQLIEESQEQQAEHFSAARPKSKEKKMPWDYASEQLKNVKNKFHEWDHSEGRKKSEQNTAEQDEQPEELLESEPEKTVPKAKRKRHRSSDNLFLQAVRTLGRACKWCIYAFISLTLLMIAAGISFGLLGAAAFVLGMFVFAVLCTSFAILVCIAGIIASGFGFLMFGKWEGIAILSTTLAGIGFFSLITLLLYQGLKKSWRFSKSVFKQGAHLWYRMLKKIESWLMPVPNTSAKQEEQPAQAQPKETGTEPEGQPQTESLPVSLPAELQQTQEEPESGKEGC